MQGEEKQKHMSLTAITSREEAQMTPCTIIEVALGGLPGLYHLPCGKDPSFNALRTI